ncbi:hypothetical protein, partial [Acidithiobacillus ferriphilus]|uniref:hypothetical protein n=1 Tax=Acidithiobacillus ferriphilus TaxID=1689834 RepID=UPI00243138A4
RYAGDGEWSIEIQYYGTTFDAEKSTLFLWGYFTENRDFAEKVSNMGYPFAGCNPSRAGHCC